MKTSIPLLNSTDLEQLSATVGFWVGTGTCHLIETHQGMTGVNHLSPSNICFCFDGRIVITSFDEEGMEGGEGGGGMSSEWRRYCSPEMLKGEIKEGNEKSVVFVLGMIINSMLEKEIPFKDVDCVSAGELIISGKRPSVSSIENEHKGWMSDTVGPKLICTYLNQNVFVSKQIFLSQNKFHHRAVGITHNIFLHITFFIFPFPDPIFPLSCFFLFFSLLILFNLRKSTFLVPDLYRLETQTHSIDSELVKPTMSDNPTV
jgi:hypothetical protein